MYRVWNDEFQNVDYSLDSSKCLIAIDYNIELVCDKNGEIKNFNRDLTCTIVTYVANISTLGYVNLTENGISVFHQKFIDIQSITTYSKRRIELEFSEVNKK